MQKYYEYLLKSKSPIQNKIQNFPKYLKRQTLSKTLVRYELFKKQLKIKGSIIECGVHEGFGIMSWGHFSSILEPYNYHRKIIGFDTFKGFPNVSKKDKKTRYSKKGAFKEKYNTPNQAGTECSAEIKSGLSNGFPIVFGFIVYESFESEETAKTGIVKMPEQSEKVLGGHAVTLVGYDDTKGTFKVRNSWSAKWGDKGYCYFPYEYLTNKNLASDFWQVEQVTKE